MLAADHQAVAVREPPDAARNAGVDVLELVLAREGRPPLGVAEVRIASVDDDVTRLEQADEGLDGLLGRIAGRDHQPDGPPRLELADQLLERGRRAAAASRVGRHLVPIALQALRHVPAHAAQSDHCELHRSSSLTRTIGRPRSCSAAKSPAA